MNSFIYKIYHWLALIPPKIKWGKGTLTNEQKNILADRLALGYYIILTGCPTHLSSLFVSFMTLFKLGRWSRYSHALMNCDYMDDPNDRDKFKFVEATSIGVNYNTFESVFDVSSVCLLSLKDLPVEDLTTMLDYLIKEVGTPYDDLFDLSDKSKMSCVEVVLDSLRGIPDYTKHFGELDKMIQEKGNLLPQMYRDCKDFVVEYEII